MEDYPRIMVVSGNAFSKVSNNGKTLECLLNKWPCEKIAHIYFTGEKEDTEFCHKFFSLTIYDVIDKLISFEKKEYATMEKSGGNAFDVRYKSEKYTKPIKRVFNEMKERIGDDNVLQKMRENAKDRSPKSYIMGIPFIIEQRWIKKEVHRWIGEFEPELILLQCSGDALLFKIAHFIRKKYNIPMILQILDDFTTPLYPKSLLEKIVIHNHIRHLTSSINRSSAIITISDKMSKEYEDKFGEHNYYVFSNARDLLCCEKSYDFRQKNIRFLYTGNLGLERINVLADLGKILDQLRSDYKKDIELRIFSGTALTQMQKRMLEGIRSINFMGFILPEKMLTEIENTDFLLHVESFSPIYRKRVRLSMSTKIGEYLSANRCIVAIGPGEVASIDYIKKNRLGFVIDDENFKINKVEEIFLNKCNILSYIKNARNEYERRFTQQQVNNMITKIIREI